MVEILRCAQSDSELKWKTQMYRKTMSGLALFGAAAVFAVGCRPVPPKPRRIEPIELDRHTMTLEQMPLDVLGGRTIVIDPGHGGPFSGAKSPRGLRESDVNLDVGLQVWALLKRAGANPILTRSADCTVAHGKTVTLRDDLEARAQLARDVNADILISIHHNADIHRESELNDLKVYYKMSDEGASFDMARALVQRLAVAPSPDADRQKLVLPGNFRVLRESPCPAVLTETSYMTALQNEPFLAAAAYRREEAYAIVGALADYFSRGFPSVGWLGAEDAVLDNGDILTAQLVPGDPFAVDPNTIVLAVDGQPLPHTFEHASRVVVTALPPLAGGDHTARVSFRNTAGNAAVDPGYRFRIEALPRYLMVRAQPATLPEDGEPGFVRVLVNVFDANMFPAGDGEQIELAARNGEVEPVEVALVAGEAVAHCRIPSRADQCEIEVRLGDISGRTVVARGKDVEPVLHGRVIDAEGDRPVVGATVVTSGNGSGTTDSYGYFVIRDPAPCSVHVSAPGYIPEIIARSETISPNTVELRAVAGGALHGRRVAVDPQYGGNAHGRISPTGIRAADINLRVSELLKSFLTAAGAECKLVRTGNSAVLPLSRVSVTNEFDADLYVEIGHGAPPEVEVAVLDETGHLITDDLAGMPYVAAYPSSPEGNRLAGILARQLEPLVAPAAVSVLGSSSTTVTHTACPAVSVHVGEPVDEASARRLNDTAFQREEAYVVFTAIAEWAGVSPKKHGYIAGRITRDGEPVAGRLVTLDGWLSLQTGPSGMYHFQLVPPGLHYVAVTGDDGEQEVRSVRVKARRHATADFSLPSREVDYE